MNRIELENLFDEFASENWIGVFWNNRDNLKIHKFIFNIVIPEVLKNITQDNDIVFYNYQYLKIKEIAKELYNIDL